MTPYKKRLNPYIRRMAEDMQLRNLAASTIDAYTFHVDKFCRYFDKPADQLGVEEIRQYQLYLVNEKKASWSSFNQAVCGLRFLYEVTLAKPWDIRHIPFGKRPKKLQVSLLSWIVGFSVICIAIGFPFTYRSLSIDSERARGASLADEQWASGDAVVFHGHDNISAGDAYVEFHVDPDTGLTRRHQMSDMGFRNAYNARIAELIKLHGVPDWSLKEHIPSAEDVATLLDSKDLVEITSFPHELTPSIVLMRRGTTTRWGSTSSSGSDSLSIVTERGGMIGVGDGVHPVHVRITDPIVVIRNGKTWVAVFHKDGRMIASASRF